MFAPSRTRQIRFSRALTIALGAIAAVGHSAAAQSVGVEWELSGNDAFVAGSTPKGEPLDPALIVKNSEGKSVKELLCTKEQVPVPGTTRTQPLVAVTYDLGQDGARVLEIVTGPVVYNTPGVWPKIEGRIATFLDVISPSCESLDSVCETTAAAALKALGDDWQVCPGTAFDDQVGTISFIAKHRLNFLSTVNTQVNVAMDLPRIGRKDRSLYTETFDKSGFRFDGMGPEDTLAVAVIHGYLTEVFNEAPYTKLDDNERGFLTWYFTALNVERVAKVRGFAHNHFQIKNLFDLYLKAPLDEIYRKLSKSRIGGALSSILKKNSTLAQKGQTTLCVKVVSAEPCDSAAWQILMSEWYAKLTNDSEDPLELRKSEVTKAIAPYDENGQIKVVVESRLTENPLNHALGFVIRGNKLVLRNPADAITILDAYFK